MTMMMTMYSEKQLIVLFSLIIYRYTTSCRYRGVTRCLHWRLAANSCCYLHETASTIACSPRSAGYDAECSPVRDALRAEHHAVHVSAQRADA